MAQLGIDGLDELNARHFCYFRGNGFRGYICFAMRLVPAKVLRVQGERLETVGCACCCGSVGARWGEYGETVYLRVNVAKPFIRGL